MTQIGIKLHYLSVVTAALLFAVQLLVLPVHWTSDTNHRSIPWCLQIAALLAAYGFISGFILMVWRKGESESVLLGVSTIAALVLTFFAGGSAF